MRIRLPANTFIGGANYSGRRVDIETAISLAAIADDFQSAINVYAAVAELRDKVQRQLEDALRRESRAEQRNQRNYQSLRAERMEIQDVFRYLDSVLFSIEDIIDAEEKAQAKRARKIASQLGPYDEFDDDEYPEWEFGFEYSPMTLFDLSSAVDVNFHVRRSDGRPFNAQEALQVMRHAQRNEGRVPAGYRIAATNWRSPNKKNSQWKNGTAGDVLDSGLVNVMNALRDVPDAWRLGDPKE